MSGSYKQATGGFCPLIGCDCVQDKCEWAYTCDGEYKWCRIVDIARELERFNDVAGGANRG